MIDDIELLLYFDGFQLGGKFLVKEIGCYYVGNDVPESVFVKLPYLDDNSTS